MARHPVIDLDPATVAPDEDLHEVEAEPLPDAPFLLLVATEDRVLLRIRHTWTGILDRDTDRLTLLPLHPDGDPDTRATVLHRVPDEVVEDHREQIVGEDPVIHPFVADGAVRIALDRPPDGRIKVNRPELGDRLVDLADRGDILEDLDTPPDAPLEARHVPGPLSLQAIGEQFGVEIRDIFGVPYVMGQDIHVEVRLVPRRLDLPVQAPERLLGLFAPGDILDHPAERWLQILLCSGRYDTHGDMHGLLHERQEIRLKGLALSPTERPVHHGLESGPGPGPGKVEEAPPDQALFVDREEHPHGAVGLKDPSAPVRHQIAFRGGIEELVVALPLHLGDLLSESQLLVLAVQDLVDRFKLLVRCSELLGVGLSLLKGHRTGIPVETLPGLHLPPKYSVLLLELLDHT